MEDSGKETLIDLHGNTQLSLKDSGENNVSRHIYSDNSVSNDLKTNNSLLDCPSLKTEQVHLSDLDQASRASHSVNVGFPVSEEDFRSAAPVHVSVLDGQVIHVTSRPFVNNSKKQKMIDVSGSHEEIASYVDGKRKSIAKSHTLITSSERSCMLSHEMSADGDYLLAEGVLCEDILPSSDMLPEEQILTIPSPSAAEFNTGAKPDVLAIAASEVFSDSCISIPLQENKCVTELMECQVSEPKLDGDLRGSNPCGFGSSNSSKSNGEPPPSHQVCDSLTAATSCVTEKDSKICLSIKEHLNKDKESLQKSCEANVKSDGREASKFAQSTLSKWHAISTNSSHSNNGNTASLPVANAKTNQKPSLSLESSESAVQESDSKVNISENASDLSKEILSNVVDEEVDGSSDKFPPSESSLRRSSRISKCKRDPNFIENDAVDEPEIQRRRRAGRGMLKKSALWDCVKCDAMFRTRASRNRHMQEGHLFKCFICNWQGLTKLQYEIHVSTTHCSLKARCLMCKKDFPSIVEYKRHMQAKHLQLTRNNSEKVTLDECIKESCDMQMESFERHLNETEEDVDDPDYEIKRKIKKETIIDSESERCKEVSKSSEKLVIKDPEIERLQDEGKSACPYCHKMFGQHSRFVRHLNYHVGKRPYGCKICKKLFVEKHGLEVHQRTHSPINEPCCKCGKVLKTLRSLKQHLRTHSNTLYKCSSCPKQFRSEESLRIHKSVHKEGGSGNSCKYCNQDCKTPYYLRLHMANKHEASKYSCEVCFRSFKWQGSYRKHMSFHNKNSDKTENFKHNLPEYKLAVLQPKPNQEKKYPCNICGKLFRHEFTRDKHTKIVHQEERKHMCPHCGSLFKAKGYLDQHLSQVHTTKERVKCQTCGHDFKTEAILKNHIKLVHSSTQGKYACDLCKKAFLAPKDLLRHSKVHTGEKNHVCPICRRSFSRKDNMTSHLRTHTKNNAQAPVIVPESSDLAKEPPQSNAQDPLHIMGISPVDAPSCSVVSSANLQSSTTPTANIIDSVTSLVSGSITFSTLPLSSISLPSSISSSLPSNVVYSNSSGSSACIVLSSKPPSSSLPVVVFSGSGISNNHVLPNSQPILNTVSLGNIHSSLNDFPIIPPSTSLGLRSSVTTLTYSNNAVSLPLPSTHQLYPTSSVAPLALSSVAPVSSNSHATCIESVQDPSVFSPSLHTEQIVLAEEVLTSTSVSSQP